MRSQALDFLCDLLEVLAFLGRPTLSRAMHGYRFWGRPGVSSRDLLGLGKRGYLEMEPGARDRKDRVLRLTQKGRLRAMGGRDPEACWSRPWDGKWRMVLFDIPEKDRRIRDLLRRHLGAGHFGYLQNSVWVSPDPLDLENRLFKGTEINAESLLAQKVYWRAVLRCCTHSWMSGLGRLGKHGSRVPWLHGGRTVDRGWPGESFGVSGAVEKKSIFR